MICAQRTQGKLISSVVLNDVFSHTLAALQRLQECPFGNGVSLNRPASRGILIPAEGA
jgi:hypothetical protein